MSPTKGVGNILYSWGYLDVVAGLNLHMHAGIQSAGLYPQLGLVATPLSPLYIYEYVEIKL